jgi:hypothetical protein
MFLVALRTMNLTQWRWIGVIVELLPLKNELGVYTTTSTSIVQSGDSIYRSPHEMRLLGGSSSFIQI